MSVATGTALALGVTAASAAGSVYGANKQAGSNKDAIAAQTTANDAALKFETQKYNDLKTRMQPWIASGQSSNQRMAELLRLPPSSGAPAGGWNPNEPKPGDPGSPVTGFSRPGQQGAPVTLRAPDGTTRVFTDPAEIARHRQRGAEVVS